MSAKLNVRIRRGEGCLLRLLGQIGRRGYDVLAVSARLSADGTVFDVAVLVEPFLPLAPGKPRPLEVLPALLRKLIEVESAELVETPTSAPAKAAEEKPAKAKEPKPTGEMAWEE
ncbi:MAG TPA: hypothetical protein VKW04_04915 [Planctomycetota bacterium]|nr:hypothetical protein [Planctomycetota bacterium]